MLSIEELKRENIPFSDDVKVLANTVKLDGLVCNNALVVHPMEGYDANTDGSPTELTYRRYRRFGAGGAGLIWFEATAVCVYGRSNPYQLLLNKNNLKCFEKLVKETRKSAMDAMGRKFRQILVLQVNHSGRYTKSRPVIAQHSKVLDATLNIPSDYPLITDDELAQLIDKYVETAKLCHKIGFDAIDVKACHGYLISELLSSFTRDGKYGGAFENRTRFLCDVIRAIRHNVPKIKIFVRLNTYDGIEYPYGFGVDKNDYKKIDLSEPIKLIKELKKLNVSVISITAGNPYFNPFIVRPADKQVCYERPLEGIKRFVSIASEISSVCPDISIVSGGYSHLRELFPYVASGLIKKSYVKMIGLGRGGLAYPDFAKDIINYGTMKKNNVCITCGKCTELMRKYKNVGCVIRDPKIYAKTYNTSLS